MFISVTEPKSGVTEQKSGVTVIAKLYSPVNSHKCGGNRNQFNGLHSRMFIGEPETTEYNPRFALLKDVLLSVTDKFILVTFSNLKAAHTKIAQISSDLEIPIVNYASHKIDIEVDEIKSKMRQNPIYVIILQPTDVETFINLLKNIREEDSTGKVLLIMHYGAENDKIKEHVRTSDYYEVYFAVPTATNLESSYELLELCAYCNEGVNSLNVINHWESGRGFKDKLMFPPSFKSNFYSANIKVATNLMFWIVFKYDGKYYGIEHYLLLDLTDRLNFTLELIHPKIPSFGSLVGGKWTGVIGLVYDHQADIAMGTLSITSRRFTAVNPTSLVDTEKWVLYDRKPTKSPRWEAVFEAMTYEVWITVLTITLIVGVIHYLCCRFIPGETRIKISDAILAPFQILCVEPWRFRYPAAATVILFIFWMHSAILLQSFYICSMQSILVKPKYSRKPVDTIEKLKLSDKKIVGSKGSSVTNFLLNFHNLSDFIEFFQVSPRLQGFMVSNTTKYVRYFDRNNIFTKAIISLGSRGLNPYHIGNAQFMLAMNSWMVRKNCPFRNDISKALMDAHRFGFVKHYSDKLMVHPKTQGIVQEYANLAREPDLEVSLITFTYIWEIIKIYMVLNLICMLFFILEIGFNKITHDKERKQVAQSSIEQETARKKAWLIKGKQDEAGRDDGVENMAK